MALNVFNQDVVDEIKNILKNQTNIEVQDDQLDTDFKELGLNSIDFIKMIVSLEKKFSIEFPIDMLCIALLNTVKKIEELIIRLVDNTESQYEIKKDELRVLNKSPKDISLLCITNISLDPFLSDALKKSFDKINIGIKITIISEEDLYDNRVLENIDQFDYILIWINLDELSKDYYSIINDIEKNKNICNDVTWLYDNTIKNLRSYTSVPIFIISMEDCFTKNEIYLGNILNITPKDLINYHLASNVEQNITIIDFERILLKIGLNECYNSRYNYSWNCPYDLSVFEHLSDELLKQHKIITRKTPKCIILDCDNVLWGGEINEVGIEGIILSDTGVGKKYSFFQKFIKSLYYKGVILAICSKNDIDDIENVFEKHNGMILKKEDISCFQVNWNNKIENIKKIAKYLNIGLNSMVFIDDSYFEVEAVKQLLPEVNTFIFDENIYSKLEIFCLPNCVNVEDLKLRNDTYKTNKLRIDLEQESKDYNEYLKKLNTEVNIKVADYSEYNRISELSLRVNKCTNGKRYSLGDLGKAYKNTSKILYSVFVKDIFGDLGLVGVIGIDNDYLDLFCLSCRALGRNIEKMMMDFIVEKHRIKLGYYSSTGKNTTDFFTSHNILIDK